MKNTYFEEKESHLSQFCDNQNDYSYLIDIDEYEPDLIKDLEERVRKNLLFF